MSSTAKLGDRVFGVEPPQKLTLEEAEVGSCWPEAFFGCVTIEWNFGCVTGYAIDAVPYEANTDMNGTSAP